MWSGAFIAADFAKILRKVSRDQFPDTEFMSQKWRLSSREREVMDLLLKGKRYREIGETLFISKATVKTYVLRIYQKAGVSSKMELVNKLLIR
jgi:DNA-binding CsgD family transcriptional regulator